VPEFDGLGSVPLDAKSYDCVAIVTAHSSIDYDKLVEDARVVVDLRNATGAKGTASNKVFKL
jgi:UDP-N-acetyl-D-glucosamine dehydrogenase